MGKLSFLVAMLAVGALALAACGPGAGPGQPTKFVSVATAGTGGTYYIVGAGMAKLFNKYIPGVRATSETTAGSVENIKLIAAKKVYLALVTSDTAFYAYKGTREFKEKYDIQALGGGHLSWWQVVVKADSGIKTWADMKGKRVAVGAPGSANEVIYNVLMEEAYGLKRGTDYKPEYLSYTEQVSAMKDGTIDVAQIMGGLPTSATVDLANSLSVRFVPVEPEIAQKFSEKHPYWFLDRIPKGFYRGVDADVPAMAHVNILIAHKDADPELVYTLTKTIYEHTQELGEVHPAGKEWTLENAKLGIAIPWHPGAEKYLKEKGVLK